MLIYKGEIKHIILIDKPSQNLEFEQEEGSKLYVYLINASGENFDVENFIKVEHQGKHCQTHIYGLALLGNDEHVKNHTAVVHKTGEGKSEQLFKYVLANNAVGSFIGELKIEQNAQHVEAYQTNRNILLSDFAKMHTEPQLEIYADDVKASHGASTGRLSDEMLFYMQQRGISLPSARLLLLNAFFADVVDKMPQKEQEQLNMSISDRLKKLL